MPTHSQPRCTAARTAPRMTALSPGASPPPVEMAIFTSARGGFLDQADHFARCGMSAHRLFGEYALALHFDVEDPAGGLDELDLRVRKGAADLGRQTGGPGFVVSNDTVLDADAHVVNDSGA